jgi:ubiquinone/menaquinone biosynthesis C-methylase UbiE
VRCGVLHMARQAPDFAAIKQRQQKMWSAGDFAELATPQVIVGERLLEAMDPSAGHVALDIACGSGTATLAAARRGCITTGIDYVPYLLERGRERAAAEHLEIDFQEGDAENLEFPDETFDIVVSTFGVMFAPHQEKAAAELLRVCKPGGKIGLTCWTPEGAFGVMLRLTAGYFPPAPGLRPPMRWGTEAGVQDLLGDRITDLSTTRQMFRSRALSSAHWQESYKTNFGPTVAAYQSLDPERQRRYTEERLEVLNASNVATDGTFKTDAEYLEIVATKTI